MSENDTPGTGSGSGAPQQPGYTQPYEAISYPPAYPPPPQQYGAYPPPPGPGYPPQYGPQWAPPRPTNGMAVASMVLGILWLYWVGSVLALIFGYIARNQIRERNEAGDGMAIAGIVLGWVGVGVIVLGGLIVAIVGISGGFAIQNQ